MKREDLTLKEVKQICQTADNCHGCPLYDKSKTIFPCPFDLHPSLWHDDHLSGEIPEREVKPNE